MSVNPIPSGYHTATVYLYVRGCAAALDYYQKAFGATEIMRIPGPDGKLMHAEMNIGDSRIMLADEVPERDVKSPHTLGGTSSSMMLYVTDVDATFAAAIAAGGQPIQAVKNQFYGARTGTISDPFGHKWTIATHIEDVTAEQMQERAESAMKQSTE